MLLKRFTPSQWRTRRQRVSSRREGALLLIVLVVVVMISLSAYTFTTLMQTEDEATRLQTLRLQTKYITDSGLGYTQLFLANSDATIRENGGLWNNEEGFSGIPVAAEVDGCLLYTSPSPRDQRGSRMPSSA